MSKSFYPHAVALGSTIITQLTDMGVSRNLVDLHEYSSGDFEPMFTGSQMSDPLATIGTTQIKSFLQAMASNGHGTADLSGGNVDLWWRGAKPRSARYETTDTNHIRARCESNAFAVLQSITANGLARLDAQIIPLSTDGTSPMVWTVGQTLAGTSAASEFFKNGPIKINGTVINTTGWTYTLNPQMDKVEYNGEGFYSYANVQTFKRQLTFQTPNVELMNTFSTEGTAVTAGTWFLRRYKPNNQAYLTTDEQHIKFAVSTGHLVMSEVSGSKGVCQGVITFPRSAAETAPVVATFDQAIT